MKTLLREACHKVNKSTTKTLSEAERLAVRKRYRTILNPGRQGTARDPAATERETRADREVGRTQPA